MRDRARLSLTPLAMLAACATPTKVAPPVVVATIAPPAPPLPAGGYAELAIPARRADGRWVTPNIDVSEAAAVWHLRGALNVAALSCDVAGGPYVTAYNSWLRNRAAVLKSEGGRYTAEWQTGGGADWRATYDSQQTRLYNFYSQTFIRAGFCAVALNEVAAVEAVPDADLPAHARAALARLDQPFIDFYTAFDRWRSYKPGVVHPALPPIAPTMAASRVTMTTSAAAAPPRIVVAAEVLDRYEETPCPCVALP